MGVLGTTIQLRILLGLFFYVGACEIASAVTFSELAQRYTFSHDQNVGFEAEFTKLNIESTTRALVEVLGGDIRIKTNKVEGRDRKGLLVAFDTFENRIENSSLGEVVIKPEDNGFDMATYIETKGHYKTVEIVTSPIREQNIGLLHNAVLILPRLGAVGTENQFPVSLQVSVEIASARTPKRTPAYLIKLLRDYFSEPNYSIIRAEWTIPPARHGYIGRPSDGFMKKLSLDSYRPSLRQFYDDAMYRQAHEMLIGPFEKSWKGSVEAVRAEVLEYIQKHSFEAALRVFKWNDIKLTNLLIYWFPNDPLSRLLVESTWFQPIPAIEFRAPNNDFDVLKVASRVLSLIEAARDKAPLQLEFDLSRFECGDLLL